VQNRPGSFTPQPFGHSIVDEFTKPGNSSRELHMRTNIPPELVPLIILAEESYTEFNDFAGLEMLQNLEALSTSKNGERIKELIDVWTGRDSDHKNPKYSQDMRGQVEPYRADNTQNR
jgi:hypothetical protein